MPPDGSPRVAVFGGGAVGLGLASCLHAAGATVHVHLRSPNAAAALRAEGLHRTGILGEHRAAPASFGADTRPEVLGDFGATWILVCTKSTERDAARETLAALWERMPASPPVVLCQNGWGHAEHFARALPRERIFNAAVTTGFRRTGATEVEVTVHGATLRAGSVFVEDTKEVEPLCVLLSRGGLPSEPSSRMEAEITAKLLYNCALNPLAAVLGVPYGVLGEQLETRRIVEAVVRELFAVLGAAGRDLRWPTADAYLEHFFAELLPATREHESSMLQDLRAGRATEIDALSGAVVALGGEVGVAAPANQALATLVRALHPPGAGGA